LNVVYRPPSLAITDKQVTTPKTVMAPITILRVKGDIFSAAGAFAMAITLIFFSSITFSALMTLSFAVVSPKGGDKNTLAGINVSIPQGHRLIMFDYRTKETFTPLARSFFSSDVVTEKTRLLISTLNIVCLLGDCSLWRTQ